MTLSIGYQPLVAFLLVTARAVAWLLVVPPFSNRSAVPTTVTICVATALGVLVAPSVPVGTIPLTTAGLVASLVVQVLSGAAMGFVVYLLLQTVTAAGDLITIAGGLSLPPSLDPLSLDQVSVLGQFYEQIAVVLFFISGGYWLLLDGFARSFQGPAFTLASTGRVAEVLVVDLATMFTSALEIAAPILVVLFATEILLALLTKAAPQMNVWFLGMPIQIFLALALVAIGVSVLPAYLGGLLSRMLGDTAGLLGGR